MEIIAHQQGRAEHVAPRQCGEIPFPPGPGSCTIGRPLRPDFLRQPDCAEQSQGTVAQQLLRHRDTVFFFGYLAALFFSSMLALSLFLPDQTSTCTSVPSSVLPACPASPTQPCLLGLRDRLLHSPIHISLPLRRSLRMSNLMLCLKRPLRSTSSHRPSISPSRRSSKPHRNRRSS